MLTVPVFHDVAEGAATVLVDAVEKNFDAIRRVVLERKAGKKGYRTIGHLNVFKVADLKAAGAEVHEPDLSATEIADDVWEMANAHVEQHGDEHYRFRLEDENADEIVTTRSIYVGGKNANKKRITDADEAMVKLLNLGLEIGEDQHAMHMKTLEKYLALLEVHAKISGTNAEVEKVRIEKQYDMHKRQADGAIEVARAEASARKFEASFGMFTRFGEKFGEKLAEVFGPELLLRFQDFWAHAQSASRGPAPKRDLAHKLIERLDLDALKKVADEVNPDLMPLIIAVSNADDEGEVINLLAKLRIVLESLKDATPLLKEMERQLGTDAMVFLTLFDD